MTGPEPDAVPRPGTPKPDVPSADPPPDAAPQPGAPRRRAFLRGAFGAGVAGAAVAGGAVGYALRTPGAVPAADADALAVMDGRLPAVPFHGRHQAGIEPLAGRQTAVVAFDVTAANRAELTDLLRDDHRPGAVPHRGRRAAAGRHHRAALGLGRARARPSSPTA